MSLLGEVQASQAQTRPGVPCIVVRVRAGLLEGEDLDDFEVMLADPDAYEEVAMTRVLRARGIRVARGSIGRHRRGDCGCAQR